MINYTPQTLAQACSRRETQNLPVKGIQNPYGTRPDRSITPVHPLRSSDLDILAGKLERGLLERHVARRVGEHEPRVEDRVQGSGFRVQGLGFRVEG